MEPELGMATAGLVSAPAFPSWSRGRAGWAQGQAGPELTTHPDSFFFFAQVSEAKGGIQEWKEEDKEKEKEEEAAERTPMGEEVPNSPRTLLSLRGKARMGIPMEVKLELHPLQNR